MNLISSRLSYEAAKQLVEHQLNLKTANHYLVSKQGKRLFSYPMNTLAQPFLSLVLSKEDGHYVSIPAPTLEELIRALPKFVHREGVDYPLTLNLATGQFTYQNVLAAYTSRTLPSQLLAVQHDNLLEGAALLLIALSQASPDITLSWPV